MGNCGIAESSHPALLLPSKKEYPRGGVGKFYNTVTQKLRKINFARLVFNRILWYNHGNGMQPRSITHNP